MWKNIFMHNTHNTSYISLTTRSPFIQVTILSALVTSVVQCGTMKLR